MREKYVNTNKDHECNRCGEIIPKGTDCVYLEGRYPSYETINGQEIQTGIFYWKAWVHDHICDMPLECRKGNHNWEREMVLDHYVGANKVGAPTGKEICTECGSYKQTFEMPEMV